MAFSEPPFKHVSDHKTLKWIFFQLDLNIQKFNFKITYKSRRENLTTDTLNRKIQVLTITIISNSIREVIQEAYSKTPLLP